MSEKKSKKRKHRKSEKEKPSSLFISQDEDSNKEMLKKKLKKKKHHKSEKDKSSSSSFSYDEKHKKKVHKHRRRSSEEKNSSSSLSSPSAEGRKRVPEDAEKEIHSSDKRCHFHQGSKEEDRDRKKQQAQINPSSCLTDSSRKRKLENSQTSSVKDIEEDHSSLCVEKRRMTISKQRMVISSHHGVKERQLKKHGSLSGEPSSEVACDSRDRSDETLVSSSSSEVKTKTAVRLDHLEPRGDLLKSRKHTSVGNTNLSGGCSTKFLNEWLPKVKEEVLRMQKKHCDGAEPGTENRASDGVTSAEDDARTQSVGQKFSLAKQKGKHEVMMKSKSGKETVFKGSADFVEKVPNRFGLQPLGSGRSLVSFKIPQKSSTFGSGDNVVITGKSSISKTFREIAANSEKSQTGNWTEVTPSNSKTRTDPATVNFKGNTKIPQKGTWTEVTPSNSKAGTDHATMNFKGDSKIPQKGTWTEVTPSNSKARTDHATMNFKGDSKIPQKGTWTDVTPSNSKARTDLAAINFKEYPKIPQKVTWTEVVPSDSKASIDHATINVKGDTKIPQKSNILHSKKAVFDKAIVSQVNLDSSRFMSRDALPASDSFLSPAETKMLQFSAFQCDTPCKASEVPSPSTSSQHTEAADEEMQIVEVLQAARCEKKLEVSVVQSYGELTNMEIDSPDEKGSNVESTALPDLLIVLDTNILLSHLPFIQTIKDHGIAGVGVPIFVIPWVVLQELDTMKNGKLSQHISHKAIPAVHFIYTCLKRQDPQLWGQSMQLAAQKTYGLSAENNDDRVLQCCLQYQNLYPRVPILLCTDDKNLCNKALISGVQAVSKTDLIPELLKLKPDNNQEHQNNSVLMASETDSKTEKHSDKGTLPIIISELEKPLGKALSAILEMEMKLAFDELWMEVLYLKPPWSLSDLLQCFKKHWYAVFGMIVPRNLLSSVELLDNMLCKGKMDDNSVRCLLQEAAALLYAFSARSDYNGVLPEAHALVNNLLQTVSEDTYNSSQGTQAGPKALSDGVAFENVSGTQQRSVTSTDSYGMTGIQDSQDSNRHQEIWALFENIWNTIQQYSTAVFKTFGVSQCDVAADMAVQSMEPNEAFICLQKLIEAVKTLQSGIQSILIPNNTLENIRTLYNFINNEVNVANQFTAEELYDCLTKQEYREKLAVGSQQLAELQYNIELCNTSVLAEAKNRGWM